MPTQAHLPAYRAALERGWSPNILRPEVAREELDRISRDPIGFLGSFDQRDPASVRGATIPLPDGSYVSRLPSMRFLIWNDGFCGVIGLRWKPGTTSLPPTCLGHVGYNVLPWRRGEGLATRALLALLPRAQDIGLPFVDLTTDPDNRASQRVIEKAGGRFLHRFTPPAAVSTVDKLLYRIDT